MQRYAEENQILNNLSGAILDSAIEVHKTLGGPGLLESVYEEALAFELQMRGMTVARQTKVPIIYKGKTIKQPFVADMIVDHKVIVEIKSVETYNPIYSAQLLTYLRLSDKQLGLVINFGERYIKNGFHRVVNNLPEPNVRIQN